MKTLFATVLLSASLSSWAATLRCDDVSPNGNGVTRVEFVNPQTELGAFMNMVVSYENGSSEEYTTSIESTVDSSTAEEWKFSLFTNVKKRGFASLNTFFFVLPEDQSSTGWSLKNGARMKLILPPAEEIIHLSCRKRQ